MWLFWCGDSLVLDELVCFYCHSAEFTPIHLCTKETDWRVFILVFVKFWAKRAKINLEWNFPLLQYFIKWNADFAEICWASILYQNGHVHWRFYVLIPNFVAMKCETHLKHGMKLSFTTSSCAVDWIHCFVTYMVANMCKNHIYT